jgi:predicted ribonuclease YlaK
MRKTEEQRACGRRLTRLLDEHFGEYEVIHYETSLGDVIDDWGLPHSNDAKILVCYWLYLHSQCERTVLFTNDICLKNLARNLLPEAHVQSVEPPPQEDYKGYREFYLTEKETEYFYSNLTENSLNLLPNQYGLLHDADTGILFDKICWTGEDNRALTYSTLNSQYFGKTKPYNGDPYQALAMDSFKNNKITMVKGPAGTGKSWLSLAYLFHLLERRQIDKIIIFCNTVATKDSAKLGYYPGSREEKLLDS